MYVFLWKRLGFCESASWPCGAALCKLPQMTAVQLCVLLLVAIACAKRIVPLDPVLHIPKGDVKHMTFFADDVARQGVPPIPRAKCTRGNGCHHRPDYIACRARGMNDAGRNDWTCTSNQLPSGYRLGETTIYCTMDKEETYIESNTCHVEYAMYYDEAEALPTPVHNAQPEPLKCACSAQPEPPKCACSAQPERDGFDFGLNLGRFVLLSIFSGLLLMVFGILLTLFIHIYRPLFTGRW